MKILKPFDHLVLGPEEISLRRKELKELAQLAYGTHAPALSTEGAVAMTNNITKEETWEGLYRSATCFLCTEEERTIGMAYLIPSGNPWKFFEKDWAYIRMVAVRPGYEGQGIGRSLTIKCIEHARSLGEKTIALHTSEYMHAARHIYESLGFRKLKEIAPQWGKRYWIYTLELETHELD